MPFTAKELDSLKKAIREAIQNRKYIMLVGGDYFARLSLANMAAEENYEIEKNFIENEARNFKKLLRYEKETDREYLESELEHELSCGFTYKGEKFEKYPPYEKRTEEELHNFLLGHTVEGIWEDGKLKTLLGNAYIGGRPYSNLDRFLSSNERDLCATLYIDGLRSDAGKDSCAFKKAADIIRYYQAMRSGELANLSLLSPGECLQCTRLLVIGLSSENYFKNTPQCFIDQFEVIKLHSKAPTVARLVLKELGKNTHLDNQSKNLKPQLFDILLKLAKEAPKTVPASELYNLIRSAGWGDIQLSDRIGELRKVLGDKKKTLIKTYRKRGYQLNLSLEEIEIIP